MLELLGIKTEKFANTDLYDDLQDTLQSQANSGQAVVAVGTGANFAVGECVVIYNIPNGNFETAIIQSISSNNLTMTANLTNTYGAGSYIGKYLGFIDTTNRNYKRLSAPDLGTGADGAFVSSGNETWSTEKNYTSITIQNGHTITVSADIAIKCTGAVNIEAGGKLSAKGYGHAGGAGASNDNGQAQQGASQLGAGGYSTSANGGGGGGGDGISSIDYVGGGGGGYGTAGTAGSKSGNATVGAGGGTYNDAEMSNQTTAFLKGAGGGGGSGSYNVPHGSGGAGGGIIKIYCSSITVAGEIDCDGNNGTVAQNAGGGGGAGGSIIILAMGAVVIGTGLLHCSGGTGGVTTGSGGNGGSGRIRIEGTSITGTSTPTLATGYTSGYTAYSKYGFYFTKKIELENEAITVNNFVRQDVIVAELLGSGASAGQADVTVADGTKYEVGDFVVIKEGSSVEQKTIESIAGNVLTMSENLSNTYTTSAKVFRIDVRAYVSLVNPGENQDQQLMELKEINFEDSDSVLLLSHTRTVKSTATGSGGTELVGMIQLKSNGINAEEVAIIQADWQTF